MLRNYLKIAWRNIRKSPSFSFINIFGLGMGMACALLILLWVNNEYAVDAFHAKNKQLYQVYERQRFEGKAEASYPTQGLLAEELKKNIPGIVNASGFENPMPSLLEANNKTLKMAGSFVSPDFFHMFSYPIIAGTADAMDRPDALAISASTATALFGSHEAAIGKAITIDTKHSAAVTAVFQDPPTNSTQQFAFLRSWTAYKAENKWVNNWSNTSPNTFIELHKDADPKHVAAQIKDFIYRYQQKDPNYIMELGMQPYAERYLHSNFTNGQIAGGRVEYVRLFSIIAIVVLLIACINFMNLATARASQRAKEIGVRKVIGAEKRSLIAQFIAEALLVTSLAAVVAIAFTALVLPFFNALTQKALHIPLTDLRFIASVLGIITATGLIAGSYPALFLSSLKPVRVLKGSLKFSNTDIYLRKGLSIFQFSLSTIMIIGMIVISRQMSMIQSKNLGYNRENLVYLPLEGELINKYPLFKNSALASGSITSVSKMRNSPTVIEHHTGSIAWPGKSAELSLPFADAVVGYDFTKTLNVEMAAGRDFSANFIADSTSYLINETAAARMDLKDPVGKQISWGNRKGTIIGVMKDFHFNSLHTPIEPLIARLDEKWSWGYVLVRIKPGQTERALAELKKLTHALNPSFPFSYEFSDRAYDQLYKSEAVVSKLAWYFASLAILISCLGLFGLALFTAAQRTRELGIRKVLGASPTNIAGLLSSGFLKPIFIALIIAIPISYEIMTRWLSNFAYAVKIQWWMYVCAGVATIAIALLTVSAQSLKAAVSKPVDDLKTPA